MSNTMKAALHHHKACPEGYRYARDLTLAEFLADCDRADWILEVYRRSNPDKRLCVQMAIKVAELENSPLPEAKAVIQLIKDWLDGKATAHDCRAAAIDAMYAPATAAVALEAIYAVYAANAAFAASAAGAASCAVVNTANAATEKQCADICRKYITVEMLQPFMDYQTTGAG